MKKVVRYVDEDTLEIKETIIDEEKELVENENLAQVFQQALSCEPEDFYNKYKAYKLAEEEFNKVYEPFKENLIKLHESESSLPKSVIIGGTKLTYVSPSTRTSIDSKKLKEEEPELAKKYTKTTNVKASVRLEEV